MDINIFKGIPGVSNLYSYTDEEVLQLLYAIGWYNNYSISSQYQLNKIVGAEGETPAFDIYKDTIGKHIERFNKRSLHAKTVANDPYRQLLITIREMNNLLIAMFPKSTISCIVNTKIARILLNNDETYASLKVDEHKENGEAVLLLGNIGPTNIYINLLSNEDDTRIFAYANSNILNNKQYLTSYIAL